MTEILQVVIFGLLLGGVYALFASGLTLAFGVMRIVNLAHAVFIVAAAYVAFFAFDELGIDPLLSVILIMPLFFVLGVGMYMVLFTRIEGSPRYVEMTVLLTFGIAIMIEGLLGWRLPASSARPLPPISPTPSSSGTSWSRPGSSMRSC